MFCEAKKELKQLSKWVENTLTSGGYFCLLSGLSPNLTTSSVPQDLPPSTAVVSRDQVATSSCWRNLGLTNSLGKKAMPNMPNAPTRGSNLYWKANWWLVRHPKKSGPFFGESFGQMNHVKPFKTLPSTGRRSQKREVRPNVSSGIFSTQQTRG